MGEQQPCGWSDARASFYLDFDGIPAPLTPEGFSAAAVWAMNQWAAVIPFTWNPVGPIDSARLLCVWHPLDPSGAELGLTDEPCGVPLTAQLLSRYNTLSTWDQHRLMLCMLHELGHFLGLGHAPGGTPSIMSPVLDESLSGLTPFDVSAIQSIYGPRSGSPGSATPTPPQAETYQPVEIPLGDGRKVVLQIAIVPAS